MAETFLEPDSRRPEVAWGERVGKLLPIARRTEPRIIVEVPRAVRGTEAKRRYGATVRRMPDEAKPRPAWA